MRRGKRFSNQTAEEIIRHIRHFLSGQNTYNLSIDPLCIHFTINESTRPPKKVSDKRRLLREEHKDLSKGKRRLAGTKKRTKPKIRTVKKGRTVSLKGQVY